ncbi:unnamed protein product [Adineta steineri]|uniref:Uncharacterized protein n=1 Tax=Adineta steineri TaxID=433720 RepID=A0A813V7U2_9BILA|nr:unnamed protein product [Adineta steineri]
MCPISSIYSSNTNTSAYCAKGIARIIGIAFGSLVGLASLICIIIIIYILFCKRKSPTQIWNQPYPTSQTYEQPMSTFPYTHYSQTSIEQSQSKSPNTTEELPPAYEEINDIEHSIK